MKSKPNSNHQKRLAHPHVKQFIKKYLPIIRAQYAPEQVWLFGSYAQGHPQEWSDLDLLIVSKQFARHNRLNRRSDFLVKTGIWTDYGFSVDPLCRTPAEFTRARQMPCIVAEVVETGIRLI